MTRLRPVFGRSYSDSYYYSLSSPSIPPTPTSPGLTPTSRLLLEESPRCDLGCGLPVLLRSYLSRTPLLLGSVSCGLYVSVRFHSYLYRLSSLSFFGQFKSSC